MLRLLAVCGLLLATIAPAAAQNLSLRAPPWAQALVAADVTPTTGGRAILAGDGIELSVRVTLAPNGGGVARVIRYDQRANGSALAVRRFTGHPSTGWWLWGGDTPLVVTPTAAQRTEIGTLARAAMSVAASIGAGASDDACPQGEQVYVEVALGARSTSFTRACAGASDAAGRLALRMSEFAGSRTEEELAAAAVSELMAADVAFAAMARTQGAPAAFTEYAANDALMVSRSNIVSGQEGVVQRFASWPQGARLEWSPEGGRVSARGDMGWTWGNSVYVAPDGARTTGRYITVWTRDYEGRWRFAFDGGLD